MAKITKSWTNVSTVSSEVAVMKESPLQMNVTAAQREEKNVTIVVFIDAMKLLVSRMLGDICYQTSSGMILKSSTKSTN